MDPLLAQAIRIIVTLAEYHWNGDHRTACAVNKGDSYSPCSCGWDDVYEIKCEYERRKGR